jgi:hypothetical protein
MQSLRNRKRYADDIGDWIVPFAEWDQTFRLSESVDYSHNIFVLVPRGVLNGLDVYSQSFDLLWFDRDGHIAIPTRLQDLVDDLSMRSLQCCRSCYER